MAKPSLNDLNYGHFGQAAFDLENGSWNFGRKIGQRNHLIQLETWKKVLAPAIKSDQTGIPEHAQNIRNAQLSARALGRSNPEITPSLEFLPKLAVTSAAVTSIVRAYNPAIGPLLSYGSFTFRDHHENPRRVVALPAGECGNILRLVALRKEKHGWGSDKSIWIEGPSIVDEESGYWMEDAAPIQQVCFAQGDMRSAFLATRYPTKTVLFRPIYRADRTPSKRNKYYELPNSKIDAQPILEINIEQTGGVPHADVTFNPDYQRQIGIVDQKGNWSVWDIEGGRREGKSYALTCAALGTVTSQEPDHSEELEDADSITRDDGWAKILWIGDVNTILVFNRRTTGIFDIRSKAFTSLKCAELIPKRSADWILDVKPHPRNKRQFFVLTSSRLFLMAVISLNDLSNNDGATAGAAVLIAWAHFQGLDDITLQLYVPTTSDEDSMVLMHSRISPLIMVFRFQNCDSDSSLPFSSSDPTVLRLDSELFDATKGSQHITHFHMESLNFEEGHNTKYKAEDGHIYSSADVRFYRLSAMLSDLSVYQAIFYSQEPDIESAGQPPFTIKPLDWATIVHPRRQLLIDTPLEVEDDSFVVRDGVEATATPRIKKPYSTPKMIKSRKKSSLQTAGSTVDFSFLYDVLTGKQAVPANGETKVDSEDVSAVVERVKNIMEEDVEAKDMSRKTLMEFAEHKINVSDVDASSSQLHDLFASEIYNTPLELRWIASGQALHLPSVPSHEQTISSLYDTILQIWIAPLPINISARVRQSKENFARRIAAEVVLASTRIRSTKPTPLIEQTAGSQAGMSHGSGMGLPNLSSIQEESELNTINIASSHPWLPSSQAFPTPPPSSFSQPDFPSSFALPIPEPTYSLQTTSPPLHTSNPITRLSQHLKINNPASKVPAGVGKVLAHWTSSTDPNTYDWEATTGALDQEDDDESQELKDKARRKEERLRKRQRREEAITRGRGRVETQPSPKFRETHSNGQFPRSSPGPMFGGVGMGMAGTQEGGGSSQVPLVQSQVEPGRHGGRPVKKKKKPKMRVSGF